MHRDLNAIQFECHSSNCLLRCHKHYTCLYHPILKYFHLLNLNFTLVKVLQLEIDNLIARRFNLTPIPLQVRRAWQPTPVILPGEFHGQRSLVSYSPWCREESDTTEQLSTAHSTLIQAVYMVMLESLDSSPRLLLLLSHFSHVRLCVTPQMAAHQAPPSLRFSR